MESSWWQRLEQELEQQFDRFLSDHPNQKELLDQELLKAQNQSHQERLTEINQEAKKLRESLLNICKDICEWKELTKKAKKAKNLELTTKAELHLNHLMANGREEWQQLASLGAELAQLNASQALKTKKASNSSRAGRKTQSNSELDEAWKRFETQLEFEILKKKLRKENKAN